MYVDDVYFKLGERTDESSEIEKRIEIAFEGSPRISPEGGAISDFGCEPAAFFEKRLCYIMQSQVTFLTEPGLHQSPDKSFHSANLRRCRCDHKYARFPGHQFFLLCGYQYIIT